MQQLSVPYRIALVGVLVVGVLYLLVLKPKDEAGAPVAAAPPAATTTAAPAPTTTVSPSGVTAPGVKGLATAVERAQGAADAATQKATADGGATAPGASTRPGTSAAATARAAGSRGTTATGTTSATPTAKAGAAKAPATSVVKGADPSGRLLAPLDRGDTVVVMFDDPLGVDDAAVRRAVAKIDRRGGRVSVHVVPLSEVGDYEGITRGVEISQAPTVLVIDGKRQARVVTGYTTTAELDQLVGDARRPAR